MACALILTAWHATSGGATQVVHLDFLSRTLGAEHVYSATEQADILQRVRNDYAGFDFSFSLTAPVSGPYSTIYVNDGPEFGIASEIDFRNLNLSSSATVNLGTDSMPTSQWVTLTANVISHELGHLVGLRHFDSFGPIGSGIDPNTIDAGSLLPGYPGPQFATETRYDLMESDGVFIEHTFDQHFGARSLIKLAFNEQGLTVNEGPGARGSIATAQPLTLAPLTVPNTIPAGYTFHGMQLDVDAVSVVGNLGVTGESDYYRFEANAGDLFNFHLMGDTLDRHTLPTDPMIEVRNSSGNLVEYYGVIAFNDDEYESRDSVLFDLLIPADGDYFVRVNGYSGDTGQYELFGYRFDAVAVPEPATLATASLLLTAIGHRRRR